MGRFAILVLVVCALLCNSCKKTQPALRTRSVEKQERVKEKFTATNYIENVNGLKYEMVAVEGGQFMMGSDDEDSERDERPVHKIRLDSYYIGKFEVTQFQWQIIMNENPSYNVCPICPVEDIEFKVQGFIDKLNELTGRNYRLPTEAEWEYAARGGKQSKGYKFSGSNDIDDVAWYSENSDGTTHPVGMLEPNELGIFDMSGNVWEPCSDHYYADFYHYSVPNNPHNPAMGDYQVLRGGSWFNDDKNCRSTNRIEGYRNYGSNARGLRLAHDL